MVKIIKSTCIAMNVSTEQSATDNQRKAQEALAHLDALDSDPHFAWFVHTVLERARDDEQATALNVAKPSEERDRACWRRDLAQTLCDKPKTLRAMHARQAVAS